MTVYQTTFSISEEFLRRMHSIRKRHPGIRLEVIIDRKALEKTVTLWRMVASVYDRVYVADNHSKILIIDAGEGRRMALVTSQNLTRGNRHESAVLSTDPAITEPLLADYIDMRKNRSATMYDIVPGGMTGADCHAHTEEDCYGGPDVKEPSVRPATVEEEIERLAGIFVPLTDIATVLGIDEGEMRDAVGRRDHPWSVAYRRGKARAKITIRAKEMEFATMGSPVAIQNVRDNLIDMEADEE